MFSMTEYIEAQTPDRVIEREYYNVESEKFVFDMISVLRFSAEQTQPHTIYYSIYIKH